MGKRYREMQIRTASPAGLVLQMYDAAMQKMRRALELHAEGRIAERGAALSVALGIVAELRQALDHEKGGQIAQRLEALYLFINERLVDFNLEGRAEACQEAIRVLEPLHSAWSELVQRPDDAKLAELG